MTEYVSVKQSLEACPACGTGRIACVVGLKERLDFCMKCHQVWEPIPAGEPYTVDTEQLPFKVPCDNCAYRGGSTERQDPEAWRDLQHTLAAGGRFYCHKGVPFNIVNGAGEAALAAGDRGFNFPKRPATVDLAGECHPYQAYDTDRMRLCRGYLNAHVAPLLKKAIADVETES